MQSKKILSGLSVSAIALAVAVFVNPMQAVATPSGHITLQEGDGVIVLAQATRQAPRTNFRSRYDRDGDGYRDTRDDDDDDDDRDDDDRGDDHDDDDDDDDNDGHGGDDSHGGDDDGDDDDGGHGGDDGGDDDGGDDDD